MSTDINSVQDGKLSNEQLGGLTRRNNEIIRRINDGTLKYDEVMTGLQKIIIENLPSHLAVEKGTHEIKAIEHTLDCGGSPYTPNGWSVEKHQGNGIVHLEKKSDGQLYVNGKKVILFLSKKQTKGRTVIGNELREEVSKKEILNANILDYLLAHPELIPEDWKKDEKGNTRYIFFWGTIYRYSGGDLCVRCLYWGDGAWNWGHGWLGLGFNGGRPACVLAS